MSAAEAINLVVPHKVHQIALEEVNHLGMIEVDHRTPLRIAVKEAFPGNTPKDVV